MSDYDKHKRQMLALAEEREAEGFATSEGADPSLVRTWVSELREEGHEFVTFRVPSASDARYALAQFAGTVHDGYAQLRSVHPEAKVSRDDRSPRRPRRQPFVRSRQADDTRKAARQRATEFKRQEPSAGNLEVYLRGRRRLVESIENLISIPESLINARVPPEDVESLLEDLADLRAYAETLISYINSKVDDTAFIERVAKLRNVQGRPPEEAAAFLATADRLEREREKRLTA